MRSGRRGVYRELAASIVRDAAARIDEGHPAVAVYHRAEDQLMRSLEDASEGVIAEILTQQARHEDDDLTRHVAHLLASSFLHSYMLTAGTVRGVVGNA